MKKFFFLFSECEAIAFYYQWLLRENYLQAAITAGVILICEFLRREPVFIDAGESPPHNP